MLELENFVRISMLAASRGLGNVNTSALALFTDDPPIPADFGAERVYLSPSAVAADFGSASKTYRLAAKIFMQSANILSGGGYLVIIPRIIDNSAQPATIISAGVNLTAIEDGFLRLMINGEDQNIEVGGLDASSIETLEETLNNAVSTFGVAFELIGELTSATVILKTMNTGASATIEVLAADINDLALIFGIEGQSAAGSDLGGMETLKDAILRTMFDIPYFGILTTLYISNGNIPALMEAANTVQVLQKILFIASPLLDVVRSGFKQVKNLGYTRTRCLYHSIDSDTALDFAAGYASRALSCNFSGSNTVFTMHGKDITGVPADPISQTDLQICKNNGVDVYPDFGVPKVFTSGANLFYDQVYNRLALQLRIQISLFNFIVQTGTKIPQTESGMDGLKGEIRKVLEMFAGNGMIAPGKWNGSTFFGNPEDHIRNIKDFGYYIYAHPIAQQAQSDRETRAAPPVQIAVKEAGAIHSADISIFVEE